MPTTSEYVKKLELELNYYKFVESNMVSKFRDHLTEKEKSIECLSEQVNFLQKALDAKEKELKQQKDITKGLQSKIRKTKRRLRNELPKQRK